MPDLHSIEVMVDEFGVVRGVRIDGAEVLVPDREPIQVTASGDGVLVVTVPLLCRAFNTRVAE